MKVGLEKSFLPYTIFTITETVQVRAVLSAAISQAHLSMKDVAAAAKGNYNPFPLSRFLVLGVWVSPGRLVWGLSL